MKRLLFITAGVPVAVTAVLLLLSFLLGRITRNNRSERWGVPFAFGLSFALTYCLINGSVPEFPPAESVSWMPYIALATTALGICEGEFTGSTWVHWGLRLLLVGLALVAALYPMQHQFSAGVLLAGTVAVLIVTLGTWWLIAQIQEESGYVILLAYLICSTVASVLLVTEMSYGAMAQVAGAFSAICGVFLVYFFFMPSRETLRGVFPSLMILFPVILVSGWYFGSGGNGLDWFFLLLFAVPGVIRVTRLPVLENRLGPVLREGFAVLLVIVLSTGIVLVVWLGLLSEKESGGPYDRKQQEIEDEYDDYGY